MKNSESIALFNIPASVVEEMSLKVYDISSNASTIHVKSSIKSLTAVYLSTHRVAHSCLSDFAEGVKSLLAIISKSTSFRLGVLKNNAFFAINPNNSLQTEVHKMMTLLNSMSGQHNEHIKPLGIHFL